MFKIKYESTSKITSYSFLNRIPYFTLEVKLNKTLQQQPSPHTLLCLLSENLQDNTGSQNC